MVLRSIIVVIIVFMSIFGIPGCSTFNVNLRIGGRPPGIPVTIPIPPDHDIPITIPIPPDTIIVGSHKAVDSHEPNHYFAYP